MTNPNGANQYQTDPRQALLIELYMNPESDTFSNAYQSAMKVGYEESYAAQITTRPWFQEKVRTFSLLQKAEKVLDETLEMDVKNTGSTQKGDVFTYTDSGIVRAKTDVAKFIAETVGKKKYSKKSPLENDNGDSLVNINVTNYGNDKPAS